MLFIVDYINEWLIVASSIISSAVLWCCSQRPERMPRRMTACYLLMHQRYRPSGISALRCVASTTLTLNPKP